MTNTHNRLIADYYSDKVLDKAIYTTLSYLAHIITLIVFTSITINKIINKSTEPFSEIEQIIVFTLLMTNVAILLIHRLNHLRKKQWKDLLFEETKDLAKRYYNYLVKKENLIIQLKKLILNGILSLSVTLDIWILYQTLIKKQPIPTKFLNPNGENLSTLHAIILFIVAIMIITIMIMTKNELVIKHKDKIQTLPETFENKYGIDPTK